MSVQCIYVTPILIWLNLKAYSNTNMAGLIQDYFHWEREMISSDSFCNSFVNEWHIAKHILSGSGV